MGKLQRAARVSPEISWITHACYSTKLNSNLWSRFLQIGFILTGREIKENNLMDYYAEQSLLMKIVIFIVAWNVIGVYNKYIYPSIFRLIFITTASCKLYSVYYLFPRRYIWFSKQIARWVTGMDSRSSKCVGCCFYVHMCFYYYLHGFISIFTKKKRQQKSPTQARISF